MTPLDQLVGTLQKAAGNPELRGPLVAFSQGNHEIDLRIPPRDLAEAPRALMCALGEGIRQADAAAVGVVLPVRRLWDEDRPCAYADAEAVVLVAAWDSGSGVGSVGIRCALHALPSGWQEAHESLQWLARPLRLTLARRPLEDVEAP